MKFKSLDIHTCSLTGANENNNLDDIVKISESYPEVEWAILYSEQRSIDPAHPNYPSLDWIKDFSKLKVKKAIHFCGEIAARSCREAKILDQFRDWDRIQINVNLFKNKITANDLKNKFGFHEVILPYNLANKVIIDEFIGDEYVEISLLHDSSGGLGLVPKAWLNLPQYNYVYPDIHGIENWNNQYVPQGFAGGLNSDNLLERLESIESHVKESLAANWNLKAPFTTWIDLQTGLENKETKIFSLEKVKEFLETYERIGKDYQA